jgi:D-threo-aldose 1-dehydrogenase
MPFRAVFDYTFDGVMRSWEESLRRLRLERIDVLYVHDIGRATHADAHDEMFRQLTVGGGLRALEQLREGRAIAAFGIGVNEIAICLEVLREAHLEVILLAGRYTLLEQEALDSLLPECTRCGTSIVIGGPYNSGILATGTYGHNRLWYNYEPAPASIVERVRRIESTCLRHGVDLPAAALQFPLAHPQVACVIPGLESPQRVSQAIQQYEASIPREFWADLRQQGLLRADAPIPDEPGVAA